MPLDRPIPAFYCCYLLRSTVRHTAVYVGSTPHPVRRLDQHNGLTKGGAARTSRHTLRPWEMTCIVTGFPSHIAALQFEWAWQNPHITTHIPPSARIQQATQKKRSGQPKRPRHSVQSLLSNLHLLLRVPSFSRWPLDVRFFNEDVYKAWLRWTKAAAEPLRETIPIITDFPATDPVPDSGGDTSPRTKRQKTSHGIVALDVDYAQEKEYVRKAQEIVDFEREGACSLCHKDLVHDEGIYTICPNPGCESVTHMTCLSKHFLKDEPDSMMPIKGTCPSCDTELRWVHVVKELSLRMRGQKEVEKLMKTKKIRKGKATTSQPFIEDSDLDEDDDDDVEGGVYEELKRLQEINPTGSKMDIGDLWNVDDDSQDSGRESIDGANSPAKKPTETDKKKTLPSVIEDSDWDDAVVID